MSLFDTTVHGLRARVRSVHTDMAHWVERTSETGDRALHHTQLVRLNDYLTGTLGAVVAGRAIDPDTAAPFAGTLGDIPVLRRSIGSVHLLWEFFRDKLAQRDMEAFTVHLGTADDLAWACYEPFLKAATAADGQGFTAANVKEPPLVFYSTDRTPFAQARTRTLHPAGLDAKDLGEFAAVLQRLPVPVIGMPWDVANRMPETALIGHEAGHVIAEDLGLADEAAEAVAAASLVDDADGVRTAVWSAWCDEVFADVIGVLATGSAFVDGLSAELTGVPDEIRLMPIDTDDPGDYPTPMLRVALCEHLLDRIGVAPSTAWRDAYGPVKGPSREYVDDIAVVAAALLDRRWSVLGDRTLAEVLPWSRDREEAAHKVAQKSLAQEPAPVPFDVRTWVAAATHAYRSDPDRYLELDLDRVLATHIRDERAAGVRSSRSLREPLIARERSFEVAIDDDERLRRADRLAGAALGNRLRNT